MSFEPNHVVSIEKVEKRKNKKKHFQHTLCFFLGLSLQQRKRMERHEVKKQVDENESGENESDENESDENERDESERDENERIAKCRR